MSPTHPPATTTNDRFAALDDAGLRVKHLVTLAVTGLQSMYLPATHEFVQTTRGLPGPSGPRLAPEGTNLRYAAMAALGLHLTDDPVQRTVLRGETAACLTRFVGEQAQTHPDPGAVALAAWAAAEVDHRFDEALFGRLRKWLGVGTPLPTVDVAWMLTAAVAARELGDTSDVAERTSRLLLCAQGPRGIFPHALPAASQGRFRAHVGCYADQVYPIQALARFAAASGDDQALAAANRCAARICQQQGADGQWWWHYDVRDGSVVEGFPVYSVHQHAMGPMALFDLLDSGGDDHRREILLGLRWLQTHPEVLGELVDERHAVIWRKVGRREPAKAVRRLGAVTTSLRPGLRLPGLDRVFPPVSIDYECRPYELGWLLYAWLRPSANTRHTPPAPPADLSDA